MVCLHDAHPLIFMSMLMLVATRKHGIRSTHASRD
jgi:hypothetical protein